MSTEFTNTVVHSWSEEVGSSFADHAWNYADNLLYVYVQGNSSVRTYGLSTYNLTTKTEVSWIDMTGNFEAEMTNFDFLDAMVHIPGTSVMLAKLYRSRTPPTGDEIEIVSFNITTGAIIDSTGLLDTSSSTATLNAPVLVPVTSAGTTKYYWVFPYTNTTASPYGVSKWTVVECDTAGTLTLQEDNTTAPTPSIGLRNSVGEEGDGVTDFYFLDVDERKVKKVVMPFTWVNPTAVDIYDLNNLDATVRPRAVYWHPGKSYLLTLFQLENLGDEHLLALNTADSNAFVYDNVLDYGPTGFNARMTTGGSHDLGIADSTRVQVDAPLETLVDELGFSVNAFTICVAQGTIHPIPVEYDASPSSLLFDLEANTTYSSTLAAEVFDTEEHLFSLFYDTTTFTVCGLIGISFGEEKDPNYLDFAAIA